MKAHRVLLWLLPAILFWPSARNFAVRAHDGPAAESSAAEPSQGAAKIPRAEDDPVTLRAALSHGSYSESAPQPLLLKVDFVSTAALPADRPPLNIALVLDRSGSMKEDKKFAFTIDAARAVIENLSERDIISLVVFNDRVLVLSPAGRVVNKSFLFHRLEEIAPDGSTDLSAGLLEGIAQVKSKSAEGQVKQMLLLTDGLANQGVTNPSALRKIVEKARAKGIGLSTLGCGTEFNEKLLTDMASAGGGRYTYVKASDQIPNAFKDELRGVLEVVAQNARLEVVVSQGGAISKVYGQLWETAAPSYEINIGNLRAGERGVLLLGIKPDNFKPEGTLDVATKLTFDDPQTSERVVRAVSARASFTPSVSKETSAENQEVILYGAVLEALELAQEGVEGFDLDRYRKAQASFAQWYERARQYALAQRNQDLLNQTFLLKHFMEELNAASAQGKIHDHAEARGQLKKETDYQRYLLFHHQDRP